jgi:hypothetical protein
MNLVAHASRVLAIASRDRGLFHDAADVLRSNSQQKPVSGDAETNTRRVRYQEMSCLRHATEHHACVDSAETERIAQDVI